MNTDELDRRFLLGGLAGAAGISALAAMGKAGPLTPPAGAVAATSKPLGEIEPRTAVNATNTPGNVVAVYRITAPGSYYLAADLTGVSGKSGISIEASDVTLDLCGFTLHGVAGASSGIVINGGTSNNTVANGTVRGWLSYGIYASSTTACRYSRVTAYGNTSSGFQIGDTSTVSECISASNFNGIQTGDYCMVTDCLVRGNTGIGISAGAQCTVARCQVHSSSGEGIHSGNLCRIMGNHVVGIGPQPLYGINVPSGCILTDNTVTACATGYLLQSNNNIAMRNTASLNSTGWNVANGNRIVVYQPGVAAPFTGASGGTALGPGGSASYDPNGNFTI